METMRTLALVLGLALTVTFALSSASAAKKKATKKAASASCGTYMFHDNKTGKCKDARDASKGWKQF
jgi:predicted transglutaminase-like cysteine proteinase